MYLLLFRRESTFIWFTMEHSGHMGFHSPICNLCPLSLTITYTSTITICNVTAMQTQQRKVVYDHGQRKPQQKEWRCHGRFTLHPSMVDTLELAISTNTRPVIFTTHCHTAQNTYTDSEPTKKKTERCYILGILYCIYTVWYRIHLYATHGCILALTTLAQLHFMFWTPKMKSFRNQVTCQSVCICKQLRALTDCH